MKQKASKGKKIVIGILSTIGILVLLFLVIGLFSEPIENDPSISNEKISTTENENYEQKTTKTENQEKIVYEDSDFKVTYLKFEDPHAGITAFNLCLRIENNSDKTIVATLADGYANDTSIMFTTGVPVKILPSKKAVGVFTFGYNNLGIDSIDEIKKLEFKIDLRDDESFDTVCKSKTITLDF